jgi:hypothetical protein
MALADVIAKELERDGIEVTWDKITRETRARQERISDQDEVSQMQRSYAFGRAMVKPSDLVEDRPAILKPQRHPPPAKPVRAFIASLSLLLFD